MLKTQLFNLLDSQIDDMIQHRRWLHQHPELSFEEKQTSDYIFQFYQKLGMDVQVNVGGYGIVVTIDSGKPGKTLALRADFDALPIQEATGLPFASQTDGVMHACGHDAHTAYMMILAAPLEQIKSNLQGKIIIIHQPAEETPPGGALQMIKDGVLDGVDNIFGCHVMSQMTYGHVYYHAGPTQQARAKFHINIQGKGGHGTAPHEANDAILIASQLVVNLQSIISRRLSPFEQGVVTIGSFDGKGQFNVIKDTVSLEGDVRCMSEESHSLIETQMRQICLGIAAAYACQIELDYHNDYPVLINDPEMTDLVVTSINQAHIKEVKTIEDCGPLPPSEDFAYYAQIIPACFFYIGAKVPTGPAYPTITLNLISTRVLC